MGNTYQVRTVTQNGVGLPTSGGIIKEEHLNDEFTSIIGAFNAASGHTHNGTDSARVTVIGPAGKFSTDANAFFPTNTATVGLGKQNFVFKDLHIDNIVMDGNTITTITSGNLIVDPYTYKLEIKGGTVGSTTSGMMQLNCENNSHGQTVKGQAHSLKASNTLLLPGGTVIGNTGGGNDTSTTTLVSDSGHQTLTNKTLTTPALTTPTLTTPIFSGISTTASGNLQVKPATNILEVQGDGSSVVGQIQLNCHVNSHGQKVQSQPHSASASNILLLPGGTTINNTSAPDTTTSTLVSDSGHQTLTNKTLTSPVLNTGVSGTAIKDEDDMASNSATHLATQQSIKAYVDAQNTAQDLDIQGDSGGALSIDLDAHTLDIAGGTGIDTSGSGQTITVAIDSTVATLTGSQILSNKTLTLPQINDTSSDHQYVFAVSELAADRTVTLPLLAGNDEFVFKDHAQTLTNKTLTSPKINENVALSVTATKLNYNDITTLGTSEASKVLTADSNNHIYAGGEFKAKHYKEQYASVSSASNVTLDLHDGNLFAVTMGHNITFAFNNPPTSGDGFGFTLKLTQDGTGSRTATWPASVKWAGGSAPTLTGTANSVDVFTFFTHDAGTTYYGFTAGLNLS